MRRGLSIVPLDLNGKFRFAKPDRRTIWPRGPQNLTSDRSLVAGPILWAALGALLLSPTRSLLSCLIGGAAGYTLRTLLR